MAQYKEHTTKTGKKKYVAYIRIKGYPHTSRTFDRKTDAKTWAEELEAQMRRGLYIKDNEARKHTLAELIDRYIEYELPKREKDRKKLETHLLWWKENLGYTLLSNITTKVLAECRDKIASEPCRGSRAGKKRSAKTVNYFLGSLSVAMSTAVNEWEWLDENPVFKVKKLKEPKGRVRFLSKEERERLFTACKNCGNDYLYLLVIIAISIGARRGEIMGLKWSNVDFENKMFYFLDTKNGEDRGVPIPKYCYELLKDFYQRRLPNTTYVFATKDDRIMDLQWFWEKVLKEAQLEDFRFHDLRHTAASYLAMNGASLLDIAEVLGHKTLAMTKRYSHLTPKHTASILERMCSKQFGEDNSNGIN